MVQVNIPIPEDLHKELKLQAVLQGKTLKQLILERLEEATTHG